MELIDADKLADIEAMLTTATIIWWDGYETADLSDLGEWRYLCGARDALRMALGTGKIEA